LADQIGPHAPVIVALPADIDLTSQERAYDQLYAAFASGAAVVIADFTATIFCDCSSLRRLASVQDRAAARNAQLRFAMPPGSPVRRLMRHTDVDQVIHVYSSPDEAAEPGKASGVLNANELR
jgi:anti-anti-sigma regulatory factor